MPTPIDPLPRPSEVDVDAHLKFAEGLEVALAKFARTPPTFEEALWDPAAGQRLRQAWRSTQAAWDAAELRIATYAGGIPEPFERLQAFYEAGFGGRTPLERQMDRWWAEREPFRVRLAKIQGEHARGVRRLERELGRLRTKLRKDDEVFTERDRLVAERDAAVAELDAVQEDLRRMHEENQIALTLSRETSRCLTQVKQNQEGLSQPDSGTRLQEEHANLLAEHYAAIKARNDAERKLGLFLREADERRARLKGSLIAAVEALEVALGEPDSGSDRESRPNELMAALEAIGQEVD